MHKKATFIVERIVNELSTDEYLYPNNGEYSGFSNTDTVTQNGVSHGGSTKFCSLFISRLNKLPNTETNCNSGVVNATSIEGMDWYLPISDFQNGPETLIVDVNSGEGPNELGKDQFEYQIQPGQKVPVKEVQYYAPPEAPDDHAMPEGDIDPTQKKKLPGLNEHSISCGNVPGATILGQGEGKVNGNYMLVAIPNKGYRCDWFTKQVTVKDGDVTDCGITCTEDLERPGCEQEPCSIVPEPVPEPEPEPEPGDDGDDTYCINVTVTGESDKCIVDGAGCEKAPGIYKVTVTSSDPSKYSASWTEQDVTIEDKDVNLEVECSIGESCYNINLPENSNCDIVKPAGNCPSDGTKYLNGTHTLQVTPKEGFTYQGKTKADGATGFDVIVNGSDVTPNIVCETAQACPNPAVGHIYQGILPGPGSYGVNQGSSITLSHALDVDVKVTGSMRLTVEGMGVGGSAECKTVCEIKAGQTSAGCTIPVENGEVNNCHVNYSNGGNTGFNVKLSGTLKSDPSGCVTGDLSPNQETPVDPDKIEIKIGTLSAKYGGSNTTNTTPSVSVSGNTVTVTTWQDVTISGFTVVPSNKGKQWKLKETDVGAGGYGANPTGGTGDKAFSVTISQYAFDENEEHCLYAEYTDGSAKSNTVCFTKKEGAATEDTISINTTGAATRGNTHEVQGKGTNSIRVMDRDKGEAEVIGICVQPSNNEKKWEIKKSGGTMWSVSPTNGTGGTCLSITLDNDTNNEDHCITARYTDGSATSNQVCLVFDNEVSPNPGADKEVLIEFLYQFDSCKEENGTFRYANSMLYEVIAIDQATNKEITLPFDVSVNYSAGGPCSGNVKVGTSSKCGNADAEIRSVNVNSVNPSSKTYNGVSYKFTGRARNATIDPNVTSCGTGSTPDVPSEETCVINLEGTGYTQNGASGTVYLLMGKNQVNSVQLSDLNNYKATWKDLECRVAYSITTADGKDDDGNKVTLSANPSSIASLSGTQKVTVTFTVDKPKETKIRVSVNARSDGTVLNDYSVYISGPTSISEMVYSATKDYDVKPGTYTVNSKTSANITYNGSPVKTQISWSPTKFTLQEGSTQVVTGNIDYMNEDVKPSYSIRVWARDEATSTASSPVFVPCASATVTNGPLPEEVCFEIIGTLTCTNNSSIYDTHTGQKVCFKESMNSCPGWSGPGTSSQGSGSIGFSNLPCGSNPSKTVNFSFKIVE